MEPNQLHHVNPLGKVPALKLDDGQVIVSSPLIADFVDGKYPRPRFIQRASKPASRSGAGKH